MSLISPQLFAYKKSIRIGIEAAYPPFASKNSGGEIVGFDYEIGNSLCRKMGAKCIWIEQEFDGLIPALKVHKIDAVLSSMSITKDRKRSVDFTDPYYLTPARLVMRKDIRLDSSLEGLRDKRIGVQRGSIHDFFAKDILEKKGAKIIPYNSQNEIYLDMRSERLDGTIADMLLLRDGFLETSEGKNYKFSGPKFISTEYFGDGVGIAVRKGDTLKERINYAIQTIRSDGTYKEIQDKYFNFDIFG